MEHSFDDFSIHHFREQHPDEAIIAVIHRHWFDIAVHFAAIGVIFLLQILSIALFGALGTYFGGTLLWPEFLLFHSVATMFLWLYGFFVWIDYWLDVWVVTNDRVINVEQAGLFSRQVSELHFRNVQDVTTSVHGVIPTLLDYGDVEVQTAAENRRFLFRHVPNPYEIKSMVIERMRAAQASHGSGSH